MPLAPGTILGQYEIRSPLGAGGMGEVYRAHDTRLDREVAIKVLPDSVTSNPDRLHRFEQEARAAAALNHPNILAVYQMASHEGVSYLVSELLEGETLRERLRRGALPLRKAVDYAVQIAHGLAAPHEKGIVHRDLKPDNLFLTNDGRIKILDFGLAKINQPNTPSGLDATLTQGTEPGVIMGTVGYMSPEQVRGKTADHRSDIFAFGAILYELITGKQTFRKPTSAETMTAILNEDPPSISQSAPNTPPALQRVVHRCLEKNPEQRFQSASDLAFALDALSDSSITAPSGLHALKGRRFTRLQIAIAAAAVLIAVGSAALTYFWMQPDPTPRVSNYVQLTHDGQPKQIVGTDGSRLYLYLSSPDTQRMAEMSVAGGEPRKISILPSANITPISLSADGSQVLAMDGNGIPPRGPLWGLPILGGSPRRLGDLTAMDASWSPDGKMLAYTDANNLFVANAAGSESHSVVSMGVSFRLFAPVWSPDGSHLRFHSTENLDFTTNRLWEVSIDGSNRHRLLPDMAIEPGPQCCGSWTPDGKYFVFRDGTQIWALPRKRSFLQSEPRPVQLTSSPLFMSSWVLGKDGKKLFVVGQSFRGELMRYVSKSGQFERFLGGISAEFSAFSKDGQWVTYVLFPEGTLWRSKVDGSERLQLTYPPGYPMMPRWSPDGKTIVYFETSPSKPSRIYEVSAEGGTPRELMPDIPGPQQDPIWSADGTKIMFGGDAGSSASSIRIFDLATHQVTSLPGSQGTFSPRWSPDGRFVPAFSSDSTCLLLFDFQTQKWTELAKGSFGWLNFTKDGKYLEVLDGSGTISIRSIRLSDGKTEQIVDLKSFEPEGRYSSSLSIAPDDSPLMLRNAGTEDVYSLDWQER